MFKRPSIVKKGDKQGEVDLQEQNKFFLTAAAIAEKPKKPAEPQANREDSDRRLRLTKFNEGELHLMLSADLNKERAHWKYIQERKR